MKFVVVFCLGMAAAYAQTPDCKLVPGWQQAGPARTFEGESLYEYMNGNSEGYLVYGFKKMNGVTCKKDGDTVHIDISDMGDTESAYGIFCANRDVRLGTERLGTAAQVTPRKATFVKDRFYLEIAAEPEKDHSAALRSLAAALEKTVQGRTDVPAAIGWFPTSGITPGWPRLVPQSVLGMRILKRGYVGQYANGAKAFVVAEATPEAAIATAEKLKARLGETTPAEVGDSGYTGSDKYLGTMVVFRKGSYVGGYASVPAGENAVALAKALAASLGK